MPTKDDRATTQLTSRENNVKRNLKLFNIISLKIFAREQMSDCVHDLLLQALISRSS